MQDLNTLYPYLTTELRYRDEGRGIRSIFPLSNRIIRQVHFLNNTASQILDLCNGKHSLNDIVQTLNNKFPDIDNSDIERDVIECLYNARSLGLIEWDNPAINMERGVMDRVADERDFKKISRFISSCLEIDDNKAFQISYIPVRHMLYYSPITIRLRQFHGKETYFVSETDGDLTGVASISAFGPPLKSSQISTFIVKKGKSCELGASKLMECLIESIKQLGLIKLKCGIISSEQNDCFIDFLKDNKFCLEATLKGEIESGENISIYSRFL